jgi:hypothetical protein
MQQTKNNTEFEESDEISIGDLFYKYFAYWPYFVILVLLSVSTCVIPYRYIKPRLPCSLRTIRRMRAWPI